MGRGGGQVVSVLTFYSDDTAEAYSFLFENNENEQKEAGAGPVFFKKNIRSFSIFSLLFFIDRKYLFSSTGILTLEVPRGHICLIFLINQNIMLITWTFNFEEIRSAFIKVNSNLEKGRVLQKFDSKEAVIENDLLGYFLLYMFEPFY